MSEDKTNSQKYRQGNVLYHVQEDDWYIYKKHRGDNLAVVIPYHSFEDRIGDPINLDHDGRAEIVASVDLPSVLKSYSNLLREVDEPEYHSSLF